MSGNKIYETECSAERAQWAFREPMGAVRRLREDELRALPPLDAVWAVAAAATARRHEETAPPQTVSVSDGCGVSGEDTAAY
eukprot:COSAG03_NODE_3418_length_2030_cov_1.675816_2_plen_82_part_00